MIKYSHQLDFFPDRDLKQPPEGGTKPNVSFVYSKYYVICAICETRWATVHWKVAKYCSASCSQKAYRLRKKLEASNDLP